MNRLETIRPHADNLKLMVVHLKVEILVPSCISCQISFNRRHLKFHEILYKKLTNICKLSRLRQSADCWRQGRKPNNGFGYLMLPWTLHIQSTENQNETNFWQSGSLINHAAFIQLILVCSSGLTVHRSIIHTQLIIKRIHFSWWWFVVLAFSSLC